MTTSISPVIRKVHCPLAPINRFAFALSPWHEFSVKLLQIYSGSVFDGIGSVIATLARHRSHSPRIEFLHALCFPGQLAEELTAAGTPPVIIGPVRTRYPWQVWLARRRLAELIRREKPDSVMCHGPWSHALFGPEARNAGIPLIFWMHNQATGNWWPERATARHPPDLVICNSQYTASTLPKLCSRPPVPLHRILPCPVSPPAEDARFSRTALRTEFNTPLDAQVIIQVSRMEAWKGHRQLLRALGALREMPDWIAWFAGGAQLPHETEYLGSLRDEAQRLGIEERVRFLGHRRDVARLLAASDVFCQPNESSEPFGIVFIEALYAGLPVIATNIGGAPDIVNHSCGQLVPPESPEALANALRETLSSGAFREKCALAGPRRASGISAPEGILAKLEEMLLSVRGSS